MKKLIIGLCIATTVMLGDILILHSSTDGLTDPAHIKYLNQLKKNRRC